MGISTFLPLNMGMSAIDAMTQAESVVSNNISNANTAGYVQESPVMEESDPYQITPNATIGQGVDVPSVSRETSNFLIQQDRNNQGTYKMYSTHSSGLQQIQSILNEPSANGIQNALDQFFSSWQSLSSDPSNTAARQSVISQAQMLSQTYQTVTNQLEQLQSNLTTVVQGNPQYHIGQASVTSTGSGSTTSSPATAQNPIATDVEVLNAPQSSSDNFQIKFIASKPSSGGADSYSLQLETAGQNPTAIGNPVSISGTNQTYTLGDPKGLLVSIQASDPTSVVPASVSLTNGSTYTQTDSFTPPGGQLEELNGYANQVNTLNQQIVKDTQDNQSPNTLLDQRDTVLDKMANLANISYTPAGNGAMSVSIGSASLVSATGGVTPLTVSGLSQVTSGTMAGNQATINDTNGLLGQLDGFLTSFAGQVNDIQKNGYGTNNPATNAPALFTVTKDSENHVSLSLANEPGTSTPVGAGDVGASGSPNQVGDNSNALKMVALQSNSQAYNNGTFDQGVSQMVSNVGIEANSVSSLESTSNALAQQSSNMRQSVSGVDTNQQAALMIQYQNTYDAAAKFVSVFDNMLQALMNIAT